MKILVEIPDNKAVVFIEFLKDLKYIIKIETDDEPSKDEIVSNLKRGLKEMQLFKKGKLKTTSAKDFLNEL